MLNRIVRIFGGDPHKREINRLTEFVDETNQLETDIELLSNEKLALKTTEFRRRLAKGETLDDLLVEAFATVREASKRTIGLRHYDVQLIGGITLHQGKIAEMRTGEGKTLVATLPLYINALELNPVWVNLASKKWGDNPDNWSFEPLENESVGRGTHLITVNDYLARRDARWMAPIFSLLGMTIGVLQMASRTENGKKAFIVDLDRTSPHEDQNQLLLVPRAQAYASDITYGTNSEFGFDYLRDNMAMRLEDRVQRGHAYAIIDEVDNVLIDEARTPLIISGPSHDDSEWYVRMAQIIRQMNPEDYEVSEKDRTVTLTEIGETHVEELLAMQLRDPERPEDVTPEQARVLGYLEQALRAQHLFKRNKDYLIQAGKVVIIDEFTGRLMPGRRWSDGLHQAVEAKEGVRVQPENVTYATITIQNYFRMYGKLAGMTGTALTEAEEFSKIYNLEVLPIPTNLEYMADRPDNKLIALEAKDELGYKYIYYTREDDSEKNPLFWKRKDYPDVIYRSEEAKMRAIMQEILQMYANGRPVLVGTTSVELSDRISNRLRAEPLRRLAQVILLRDTWFRRNNREEDGRVIDELAFLNQPLDRLNITELRKLARQLDLSMTPEDDENLSRLLTILRIDATDTERLRSAFQAGIPHEVLNARKHTEESQIIAGAGAYGALTIATNMAGRGVDIKLGGELAEEVVAAANRVLKRAGNSDPYNMSLDARYQALKKISEEEYGVYSSEIHYFVQHVEEMEKVRELGGLHVIGSERHEARRIDNQLRGRAARQGDPGSSRFYLSMEDELMRLFGGEQADSLLRRLKVDDSMPLEVGLVGRLIEQAQTRVEGANFDTRKHLLEYDDVLNSQRAKIYAQRDRVFAKDDLNDDVTEMLRTETNRRVPEALKDPEGPWRLLAWLEQIQPTLALGSHLIPSFTIKLLLDSLGDGPYKQNELRDGLLKITDRSLKAEENHLIKSVEFLLAQSKSQLETQVSERLENLENYFDSLSEDLLEDEENSAMSGARSSRQILDELSGLIHVPIKLSREQEKQIARDPDQMREILEQEVESILTQQAVKRALGAIARRIDEPLDLNPSDMPMDDWEKLTDQVMDSLERALKSRSERLLGQNGTQGTISKEIETQLERIDSPLNRAHALTQLMQIPQGSRTSFDRRTHRRIQERTTRLTYIFYAAHLLENLEANAVTQAVLEHLENAQQLIGLAWGSTEISRLANYSMADLDEKSQRGFQNILSNTEFEQIRTQPLQNITSELRLKVVNELGRQALTEIYRELLLRVISELWIEYLTQMEALRVSIALEAYGQRDPLVQYKGRASAMFQELLDNIRLGVVTRMFTFRPRDISVTQASITKSDRPILAPDAPQFENQVEPEKQDLAEQNTKESGEMETVEGDESKSRSRRRRRRR
jgi:preprotein translocase subunit SecA